MVKIVLEDIAVFILWKRMKMKYKAVFLSLLLLLLQALLHNEFLGQNFCSEHNIEEVSRCHNYVICTGEEFLTIQGIDLSSWGFWENHLALACIMIILLTITYVQLLQVKTLEVLRLRGRNFLQLFN